MAAHIHATTPEPATYRAVEAGKEQENIAYAKMMRLGIEIVEQQRTFELHDKKCRLILRGHIDGKIMVEGRALPFDLKTMHPNLFDRFDTVDDLMDDQFLSRYPKQLMAYEYMNNIDTGFLWIDNMLGKWKFIEVPMDWGLMEKILQQLEAAVEAVELINLRGEEETNLPPYHSNPSICLKCWAFKRVCTPPFFAGEGMRAINDPALADKIARRAFLDPAASEYDKLDKEVKEILKAAMKPMDNWIIGDYLVSAYDQKVHYKAKAAVETRTDHQIRLKIEKINEPFGIEKSSQDYEALR